MATEISNGRQAVKLYHSVNRGKAMYQLAYYSGGRRVLVACGNWAEGRGYRKHGKGTFAHGHSTRVHRNIALFFKLAHSIEQKSIIELIRGAQAITASLRSALILISSSPKEWRPDMTSSLGGVIVMPDEVTMDEVDILKDRKLRFISIGESHLPKPRFIPGAEGLSFFQAGQQAAQILSRAAVTGESLTGFSIASSTPEAGTNF